MFLTYGKVPSDLTKVEDFQTFIPRDLGLEKDSQMSLEVAKRIKLFYFKDGVNEDNFVDVNSILICFCFFFLTRQ